MAEENVRFYTFKEIDRHDTEESAWLVIGNGVYDVTRFLEEHPGGAEILLEWAGGEDATHAFEDAGHSNDAREQMQAYKIGEISREERVAREKELILHKRDVEFKKSVRLAFLLPAVVFGAGILIYQIIHKIRN